MHQLLVSRLQQLAINLESGRAQVLNEGLIIHLDFGVLQWWKFGRCSEGTGE